MEKKRDNTAMQLHETGYCFLYTLSQPNIPPLSYLNVLFHKIWKNRLNKTTHGQLINRFCYVKARWMVRWDKSTK